MSAHVLLNLLNKLRKSDKVQGSQSIFSLKFCSKFYKINKTGAHMLDSIYHMILVNLKNTFLALNVKILPSFMPYYNESHY